MTWNTSFSPLAHEPVGRTNLPTFDRVEDEYVFVAVVAESTPDGNRRPVTRSFRVDPAEGCGDELVVHVSDGTGEHEPEATVTVPAPGLGPSPPVRELEAERLLLYVNFMNLDYLEAVVPGDFVYPGPDEQTTETALGRLPVTNRGFIYSRRAGADEGFQIREGCG
jgi:hypothetical protein